MAASGLVSLISLVQSLRRETIPASLHCKQENEYINWKESPFYVNKTNKPWPVEDGKTRTGAVSSFGMSGTNAHMVVQSYTVKRRSNFRDPAPVLSTGAFRQDRGKFAGENQGSDRSAYKPKTIQAFDLTQISYTLLEGRQHFQYRCALVIRDREDAVYVLKQASGSEKLPNLFRGKGPSGFYRPESDWALCARTVIAEPDHAG